MAENVGYGAIYILQMENSPPMLEQKWKIGQERLQFTSLRNPSLSSEIKDVSLLNE